MPLLHPRPEPPKATQFNLGQFFIHWMSWKAGNQICNHKHKYDHVLLVAVGIVNYNGIEYVAPAAVNIEAGKMHTLFAVTDAEAGCIHICRYSNGQEFPFAAQGEIHEYARLEAIQEL